jgi:hypothetical protein
MDIDPYKTRDEIIKQDHDLIQRLSGGSKRIRVKKKTMK